ncbi:MAG: hypothetical protein Q9M39_00115 [Sulfurovum sp.]|nr:hypothetical protein [Sulfurovum sp.]
MYDEESNILTQEEQIGIWRSIIYDYFANRYIKGIFDNCDTHFDYLIDAVVEQWASDSSFIYAWNPGRLKFKLRPLAESIDAYMLENYDDLLVTAKALEEERETYPLPEDKNYLSLHSGLPDELIKRSEENIEQLKACAEDVKKKIEEICGEDFNNMMKEVVENAEMLLE